MLYPLLLATLAGITIPIGAMLARFDMVHPSWTTPAARHAFLSFGGGVLIAAVALVLVPEGVKHLPPAVALLAFAAGGAVFYLLDKVLARFGNFGQLMAMLLDFVPEAVALGALMALGESGLSIALMIALQNLPEGFNAYHSMKEPTRARARLLLFVFAGLVAFGPLAAWFGQAVLVENTGLLGLILVFSAGGVTYLTVQDVIPEAHLDNRRAPALGAVAGFALGLAGDLYLS